jgi:hypothetical protein
VQSLMVHASRRAALCKSGIQGGMQKLNTEVGVQGGVTCLVYSAQGHSISPGFLSHGFVDMCTGLLFVICVRSSTASLALAH